jgi:hypothetical protein
MFLWFIILLLFGVVVMSYLLLNRLIFQKFGESQEFIEVGIRQTNDISSRVLDLTQHIIDHQERLDNKMDALANLVDKHSTSVTFQQSQFDALARADVLAARREELLRAKELKVALERLMGVAMTSRQPSSPNDVIALENLDNRIEELERIIDA